jgi:hypothetical protein
VRVRERERGLAWQARAGQANSISVTFETAGFIPDDMRMLVAVRIPARTSFLVINWVSIKITIRLHQHY